MFTGLIEAVGEVTATSTISGGRRFSISPGFDTKDIVTGESIAVNGVCLTVTGEKSVDVLLFDVSPETLKNTNIGELKPGIKVNLERAMKISSRFGGHLVSGHVDGVGTIDSVEPTGEFTRFRVAAPRDVLAVSIKKGSVTIDGISLTIVDLSGVDFTVAIIPHTAKETTMCFKKPGDRVNLEADMIGKYVAKLIEPRMVDKNKTFMGLLQEEGFIV